MDVDVGLLWSASMAEWDDPNSEDSQKAAELAKPRRYFWGRKALNIQIQYERDVLKLPDRSEEELGKYAKRVLGSPPSSPQGPTGQ